jgi:uncharacterized protein (DUF3084 family)
MVQQIKEKDKKLQIQEEKIQLQDKEILNQREKIRHQEMKLNEQNTKMDEIYRMINMMEQNRLECTRNGVKILLGMITICGTIVWINK